jgi:hypothetical protein
MKYRLIKKCSNRARTTFHVLNSSDDVVGSINVSPNEEADLLKHWSGSVEGVKQQSQNRNPIVAAMKLKAHPMSRAAILRSC